MKTFAALFLLVGVAMPVACQMGNSGNIVAAPAICGQDYACPVWNPGYPDFTQGRLVTKSDADALAEWIEEQHQEWEAAHSLSFNESSTLLSPPPATYMRVSNGRVFVSVNSGEEFELPKEMVELLKTIRIMPERSHAVSTVTKKK